MRSYDTTLPLIIGPKAEESKTPVAEKMAQQDQSRGEPNPHSRRVRRAPTWLNDHVI